MNKTTIALARQHAPCYIYSREILTAQAETLHRTFPGFDILFSVKANPFPPVIRHLAALGIGADAASAGEVRLAAECGIAQEDIYFSAAGKSDRALAAAWDNCHLIADSIGEVRRIGRYGCCPRRDKGHRPAREPRLQHGRRYGRNVQVRHRRVRSPGTENPAANAAGSRLRPPYSPALPEPLRGHSRPLLQKLLRAGPPRPRYSGLCHRVYQLRRRSRHRLRPGVPTAAEP